jgi:hypothetical protein
MKGRVTQSVAILRFLLSHPGIDVNCRDDYGYTPYQRSWSEEVPQIIKVFQDTPGCEPLDFVIKVIYCILIDKSNSFFSSFPMLDHVTSSTAFVLGFCVF